MCIDITISLVRESEVAPSYVPTAAPLSAPHCPSHTATARPVAADSGTPSDARC